MAFLETVVTSNEMIYYATGAADIAETLVPATSGKKFRLREIRLHLSAAGGANNFTVTLDANQGSAYDIVLLTQDMTSVTDLWELFDKVKPIFEAGDELDFAWTNGSTRTWGLSVVLELI